MNTNTRQKYFHACLVLGLFLLLWNPLPANSFPQNGGEAADPPGENKTNGITMQTVSGKVAEIMTSGGYTYALVGENGSMTWVALPKGRLSVGNEITCQPGMVMSNFNSPSLNRTFKHIVFSSGITSFAQGTAPPEAIPAPEEAIEVPKIKEPEDWTDFFE